MSNKKVLFNFWDRKYNLNNYLEQLFLKFKLDIEPMIKEKKDLNEIKEQFKKRMENNFVSISLDKGHRKSYESYVDTPYPGRTIREELLTQEFKFDVAGNPNILLYSPSTHTSANNPPEAKIFANYIIIEAIVKKNGSDMGNQIANIYEDELKKINSCLDNQKKDIYTFINEKSSQIDSVYNDLVSKLQSDKEYKNDINDRIFDK